MSSPVKTAYGSATAFSNASGLNSAASASYVNLGTIDNTTALLLDYLVEVAVTTGASAPSGNQQIAIFAIDTLDLSNFSDTTQDANMEFLGTIQVAAANTAYRSKAMSVAAAFGGTMPPQVQILAKIDDGVALAASGNSAQYLGVNATVG